MQGFCIKYLGLARVELYRVSDFSELALRGLEGELEVDHKKGAEAEV